MNRKPCIVERAVADDLASIVKLQQAMAQETEGLELSPEILAQGVQHILEDASRGFYLMAREQTGRSVGCLLVLKEWSDWRNAEVWWIHSVYVTLSHRRRGVFTAMFRHLEKEARGSGVIGLRLYVERHNVRAQQIYARLGMDKDHYELFEKIF